MSQTMLTVSLKSTDMLNLTMDQRNTFKLGLVPPAGLGGVTDYRDLDFKPSINSVTLIGDRSLEELGMQPAGDYADAALTNLEIEELLRNFV